MIGLLNGLLLAATLPVTAQASGNNTINSMKPGELGKSSAQHYRDQRHNPGQPEEQGSTVRRRTTYGQGYQYGRSVNGPYGSITIWSPRTSSGYGNAPATSVQPRSRVMNMPSANPRLQYKPGYGKPAKE